MNMHEVEKNGQLTTAQINNHWDILLQVGRPLESLSWDWVCC